jgi:Spy/CpxP family protein refolding chaperone
MKLNKSIMLAGIVASSLFTGASALQAQDSSTNAAPPASDTPKPVRARPGFDMIAKQLDLTDDQKTTVKPIIEDMMTQIRALRADQTLSQDDRRAKMKEIRDAAGVKLKDILTPDQYAKWEKMGARGGRPPGGAPSATPPPAAGTNSAAQ